MKPKTNLANRKCSGLFQGCLEVGKVKEKQCWSLFFVFFFLPTVGVVAALRELVEDMEEVLSARAKGAIGGGLDE